MWTVRLCRWLSIRDTYNLEQASRLLDSVIRYSRAEYVQEEGLAIKNGSVPFSNLVMDLVKTPEELDAVIDFDEGMKQLIIRSFFIVIKADRKRYHPGMLAKLGHYDPLEALAFIRNEAKTFSVAELRTFAAGTEEMLSRTNMWNSSMFNHYVKLFLTDPAYLAHVEAIADTWFPNALTIMSVLPYIRDSFKALPLDTRKKLYKLLRGKLPSKVNAETARNLSRIRP